MSEFRRPPPPPKPSTTTPRRRSTPKKQTPILPKDEKPKPLFATNVASSEETTAIKQTLASLRALFNGETLTYYDQFSLEPRQSCCAIVFTIVCCLIRIGLAGLILGITVSFHANTLAFLIEAFESVYPDNENDRAPAIPANVIQGMESLCFCVYTFGSLAMLVDVSLIASTALRHVRAISISLATGFFLNFWSLFFLFSIAIVGFNQEALLSSFLGNLATKDFQNNPEGDTIHTIQRQFQCCGFNEPSDWHKRIMFEWTEPGINESRRLPYQSQWSAGLNSGPAIYYSPKSCCISEFYAKPNSTCNKANMTQQRYIQIVNQNFTSLSFKIKPRYVDQMNPDGCVGIIGQQIMEWGYYALGTSIGLLILWIIVVTLLTLILAESTGLGSVNPRTQMVDPSSLKDVIPFGAELDEICCCGAGNAWPIRDENSEMEAVRGDRRALVAIEEGKSLKEIDLTATSSNIAFFLPDLREFKNFTEPSDKPMMNKKK